MVRSQVRTVKLVVETPVFLTGALGVAENASRAQTIEAQQARRKECIHLYFIRFLVAKPEPKNRATG